ncbi:Short stature homeobox protein 2 [Coemansia sp. RSA 1200]|nr:Short stature homeobox protein 2 [Coemansia sp. RSA 1200]
MVAQHQFPPVFERSLHACAPPPASASVAAAASHSHSHSNVGAGAGGCGGSIFQNQQQQQQQQQWHPRYAGAPYHPYRRIQPAAAPSQHYSQRQSPPSPLYHNITTPPPPASAAHGGSIAADGAASFIVSSSSLSPPPSSASASLGVQIKGKRKRASPQQLDVLNKVFASTSFPSTDTRNRLARELGMTPRTVQIWFQNKRQASRQRDGHHSRNTKSLAVFATSDNGLDSAGHDISASTPIPSFSSSAIGGGGGTASPAMPKMYMYGSQHFHHSKSSSPQPSSDYHRTMRANASLAMAVSPSPAQSMPSPAPSCSSALSQRTQASQQHSQQQQQLMVLVEAATASSSDDANKMPLQQQQQQTRNPEPSQTANYSVQSEFGAPKKHYGAGVPPSRFYYASPDGPSSFRSEATRHQYAHTRNDMWFADSPPARLDYLFSHSSSQMLAPKSHYHPHVAPKQPPSAAAAMARGLDQQKPLRQTASAAAPAPVNRSMSLMAMLNAPPEQRKLPPLPSVP